MKYFTKALILISLFSLSLAESAQAGDRIGVVGASNPHIQAQPINGKETRILEIGKDIFLNDVIETDDKGNAQIIFEDKSALTIGPNSTLKIDKFIYNPKDKDEGGLVINAFKGAFRFIGGALSKDKPVKINTPVSTIGIRGGITMFNVDGVTGRTDSTFIYGHEMTVENFHGHKQSTKTSGHGINVADKDARPSIPKRVDMQVLVSQLRNLTPKIGTHGGVKIIPTRDNIKDKVVIKSDDKHDGDKKKDHDKKDKRDKEDDRKHKDDDDKKHDEKKDKDDKNERSSDKKKHDGDKDKKAADKKSDDKAADKKPKDSVKDKIKDRAAKGDNQTGVIDKTDKPADSGSTVADSNARPAGKKPAPTAGGIEKRKPVTDKPATGGEVSAGKEPSTSGKAATGGGENKPPAKKASIKKAPPRVIAAVVDAVKASGDATRIVNETSTDVPPADVPPADVPPADVPPADVPPADVPPADVPVVESVFCTKYKNNISACQDTATYDLTLANYCADAANKTGAVCQDNCAASNTHLWCGTNSINPSQTVAKMVVRKGPSVGALTEVLSTGSVVKVPTGVITAKDCNGGDCQFVTWGGWLSTSTQIQKRLAVMTNFAVTGNITTKFGDLAGSGLIFTKAATPTSVKYIGKSHGNFSGAAAYEADFNATIDLTNKKITALNITNTAENLSLSKVAGSVMDINPAGWATFSGELSGTHGSVNLSGPVNGALFGKTAQDIGGIYKVIDNNSGVYAEGAFVGSNNAIPAP